MKTEPSDWTRNDYNEALIEQVNAHDALAYLTKPIRELDLNATIQIAMQRFSELQTVVVMQTTCGRREGRSRFPAGAARYCRDNIQ